MEPEELPSQKSSRVVLLSIGSLVIISIIIVVIIGFARNRVQKARHAIAPRIEQTQEQDTITGRIGLSPKGSSVQYRKGQTVTIFVYADSQEQEITGYDAVLRYDTTQVKFENVKSVLEGMDVYETEDAVSEEASELIITGIQSISQSEPFVFNNTALAEVTFTTLANGPIDIDVVYEPGSQRESNLITSRNQDILSTVTGITLDVN